jgi:hypothetical protein
MVSVDMGIDEFVFVESAGKPPTTANSLALSSL